MTTVRRFIRKDVHKIVRKIVGIEYLGLVLWSGWTEE